jgi:large subunit ribosomal protein L2
MGKATRHQRRGRGGSVYRSPGHRHHGAVIYPSTAMGMVSGEVIRFEHDPGRTSPVAHVKLPSGEVIRILSPAGLSIGSRINLNGGEATVGSILPLNQIPEGTRICNIELRPGDGGKLARSGGSSALIVLHAEKTKIQLPSGEYKEISPLCRATVGVMGGAGRPEKPFGKAGAKYHAYRSKAKAHLRVRGVAMNPVNHPHGGGSHQHIGRPSTVKKGAWPGRKVGRIAPSKKKKKGVSVSPAMVPAVEGEAK